MQFSYLLQTLMVHSFAVRTDGPTASQAASRLDTMDPTLYVPCGSCGALEQIRCPGGVSHEERTHQAYRMGYL